MDMMHFVTVVWAVNSHHCAPFAQQVTAWAPVTGLGWNPSTHPTLCDLQQMPSPL